MPTTAVSLIISVPIMTDEEIYLIEPLAKVMFNELDIIERMFERTQKTWVHKATFKRTANRRIRNDEIRFNISTSDVPYVWVSHPRAPGRAIFPRRYKPKTRPRVIGSGRGRFTDQVIGGIGPIVRPVPREFEHEIAERREPGFAKKADVALNKGVKKMFRGHRTYRRRLI